MMIKGYLSILFNTIKKMFVFKGRSNNKEYLIFTAFEVIAFLPLYIYFKNLKNDWIFFNIVILTLTFVLIFVHIFGSMSLTVRRLHDCNLKGWWYLLNFIFSPVVFIMLCFIKGNKEKNKYGEPPTS